MITKEYEIRKGIRRDSILTEPVPCLDFFVFVLPEGFEPPTTASKAAMISISPREQYCYGNKQTIPIFIAKIKEMSTAIHINIVILRPLCG